MCDLDDDSLSFAVTPFVSLALVRHRRKEARYGPSPANDYTEGYGRRKGFNWFGLRRKRTAPAEDGPNPNALPAHSTPDDLRNSYATEQTQVGSNGGYGGLGDGSTKYTPYGGGNDIPLGNYSNYGAGNPYEDQSMYRR